MKPFEPIEDSVVLLLRSGIYTESKLYVRGDSLFAKIGAGYAKLHLQGTTSVNRLYWKEIHSNQGRHVTSGCDLKWLPQGTSVKRIAAE